MPKLPSGRRIEFTLDRFHVLLARLPLKQAVAIADALREPDDLLPVLDAVYFSRHEDGTPYYANYVAAEWELHVTEWSPADQDALRRWFTTDSARHHRSAAIREIRTRVRNWAKDADPGNHSAADSAATQITTTCARRETAIPGRQPARIAFAGQVQGHISTNTAVSVREFKTFTPMARLLH